MRSAADDVRMTYVLADDVRLTYTPADNVRMMYPPADDVPDDICHPHADDVHVMPGVVLHEIRQLRQEEGSRHLEQLCIKPTGLLVGAINLSAHYTLCESFHENRNT